jgi:membrane protein required for colicin V production
MLFGFARGVLLVTLLVFLVGFTAFTRDPWWQHSVLLPQFQHVASWLEQHVPANARDYLHPPASLPQLPSLPQALTAPISGALPAPAASSPVARAKAAGQPTNP